MCPPGEIPPELGNLTRCVNIQLGGNFLSGACCLAVSPNVVIIIASVFAIDCVIVCDARKDVRGWCGLQTRSACLVVVSFLLVMVSRCGVFSCVTAARQSVCTLVQHSTSSFLVHILLCGPSVHIRSFSELVKNNHVHRNWVPCLPPTLLFQGEKGKEKRKREREREMIFSAPYILYLVSTIGT